MSEILGYLLASIRNYLDALTDVDAFRAEFAGAYFYSRNKGNQEKEANALASRLIGPIAEFSGGHRSESSLREALADAILPFEQENPRINSRPLADDVEVPETFVRTLR